MTAPVVVIDNGTGYTKMGYAGNEEPTYTFPTVYADQSGVSRATHGPLDDLSFAIGSEALEKAGRGWNVSYPIRHGLVEDWNKMERVWQQCFYKYLRVEPEESGVILTEPPANPPENREMTAEVMFETFGVKKLHIAVQGALALRASWSSDKAQTLGLDGVDTGLVIDSGAGVTHVIPIVSGYVMQQAIQHIPLAGRDITNFVLERLRERNEPISSDDALSVAQRVKERYCYIAKDMAREFDLFDSNLPKYVIRHRELDRRTGKAYTFDVGYEQFLGPELFFHPEIFSSEWTTPLPEVVDKAIWSCPIDCRRPLYRNIVLSGGNTLFAKFDKRLQKDLRTIVDRRAQKYMAAAGNRAREITYEVNVVAHHRQRYAVWYGGSMMGASSDFDLVAKTREQYEECGPSICRTNHMFQSVF